jgi:protease-4
VAQPATVTGSIGVFSGKFILRGLYDKIGLTKEIVSRGKNASLFTAYRRWSPAERKKVRELNRLFYEDFVTKAAEGRNKSYEELHEVAQGRVWTGAEALERGLIDRLGGMHVAVEAAKLAAGIEAETEVNLVVLPKPKGFLDALFERSDERIRARLPLELRQLDRWMRVLRAGPPIARLPFDIQIR